MQLSVLAENTARPGFEAEHGLSLYLRVGRRRLLVDAGGSALFARNAQKLGIDLAAVDTAVLTHGHRDHGGGLPTFLALNQSAPIYLRPGALDPHFSRRLHGLGDISVPPLTAGDRLVYTGSTHPLGDGLLLFAGVPRDALLPTYNRLLLNGRRQPDAFAHEQHLLIERGGRRVLVCGCGHTGIAAILRRCRLLCGHYPQVVVGGLHLSDPHTHTSEEPGRIAAVAHAVKQAGCTLYTGHCTGPVALAQLQHLLPGRVFPITVGQHIDL
ncbi:MBL fold metallo-hydrolase [Neobittarella massiliensis]|uniref:MBL fold metallo-hydrolase n=1 Tax=Neobittarella massiliensis (ex Bilen et al. 2018) TaxID=2041842 RepID=A0A8J6LTH1_9FIRM|nr:MBL fold metallo-hydrolase [Neobittarella massiliensis]MBC3515374.1 MBL fold metallo-hydrolase [Neobittarella massiliensis]